MLMKIVVYDQYLKIETNFNKLKAYKKINSQQVFIIIAHINFKLPDIVSGSMCYNISNGLNGSYLHHVI